MGKPRMIILIRHAQSEGNKNRDIHQTIPDHRVKLTPEGWTQSYDAGRRLRSLLRADDTLHFFTSPYRRTRETTEGILSTLTSDDPSPSPFPRQSIKVYEEPRLREQDFGNFQPCSAEMERMWQERADYGHFFYRILNGESAADAYDRISGFNESLWRQFGEDDCASVCVLVTHGLMSRVFLMKWYHFSVEYFEDLRNVNHCEFLIMRKKEDSGKYVLENKLRTWSELKRERAAEKKDKEKLMLVDTTVDGTQSSIPKRKQWGGCPDGCEHRRHYSMKSKYVNGTQSNGKESSNGKEPVNGKEASTGKEAHHNDSPTTSRPTMRRWQSSSEEDSSSSRGRTGGGLPANPSAPSKDPDEIVSSADGTPSFISVEDRLRGRLISPNHISLLHVGRDFGGSASGNTSRAGSDTDDDEARNRTGTGTGTSRERRKRGGAAAAPSLRRAVESFHESGMGRGAKADALGDQSGSEGEEEEEDYDAHDDEDEENLHAALEKEEAADKSVMGSIY